MSLLKRENQKSSRKTYSPREFGYSIFIYGTTGTPKRKDNFFVSPSMVYILRQESRRVEKVSSENGRMGVLGPVRGIHSTHFR